MSDLGAAPHHLIVFVTARNNNMNLYYNSNEKLLESIDFLFTCYYISNVPTTGKMLTAFIRSKNNYGREDLYIVNEEVAKHVRQLTGKKTVDKHDLEALKQLGVKISTGIDGHGYHIPQLAEVV